MKARNFIKHDGFGLFLAIATVIVQAFHSQYVLRLVSSLDEEYAESHASIIAGIISLAILYFTLRGKKKIAIGAAIFEAYMNICYYTIFILSNEEPNYWLFFVTLPVSGALPAILAFFSDDVMDGERQKELNDIEERLGIYKKDILLLEKGYELTSEKFKSTDDSINALNKGLDIAVKGLQEDIKKSKKEVKEEITSMEITSKKGTHKYKIKLE